jgi:ABC-2 type transport system ATP-binding protein
MNILDTTGLGKRFRSTWALADLTLSIPAGRVTALVGPNGAGKTTLLHCIVGLVSPTSGRIEVLGGSAPGSPEALDRIAFVAQDAPMHRTLSVATMVGIADALNHGFDTEQAERRLAELGISLGAKAGKLSGGQQAQLSLTLALARHPSLLVLDEPLARLDPLARHEFMALVMSSVAEEAISVIFSSHVVSELERVADHLVVLGNGRTQMVGDIDALLDAHKVLEGPTEELDSISGQFSVVHVQSAGRRSHLLVQTSEVLELPSGWERHEVGLEELVLAYLREPYAFLSKPRGLNDPDRVQASR